jgi:hypothetical protein
LKQIPQSQIYTSLSGIPFTFASAVCMKRLDPIHFESKGAGLFVRDQKTHLPNPAGRQIIHTLQNATPENGLTPVERDPDNHPLILSGCKAIPVGHAVKPIVYPETKLISFAIAFQSDLDACILLQSILTGGGTNGSKPTVVLKGNHSPENRGVVFTETEFTLGPSAHDTVIDDQPLAASICIPEIVHNHFGFLS